MDKNQILKELHLEAVHPGAWANGWIAPSGGEKLDPQPLLPQGEGE